jgi:hypothetical protein
MADPKRDLEERVAELRDQVQRLRDALAAIHVLATVPESGWGVLDQIAKRAERALNRAQVAPGLTGLASLPLPLTLPAPAKTTPSGSGSRRRRR